MAVTCSQDAPPLRWHWAVYKPGKVTQGVSTRTPGVREGALQKKGCRRPTRAEKVTGLTHTTCCDPAPP